MRRPKSHICNSPERLNFIAMKRKTKELLKNHQKKLNSRSPTNKRKLLNKDYHNQKNQYYQMMKSFHHSNKDQDQLKEFKESRVMMKRVLMNPE